MSSRTGLIKYLFLIGPGLLAVLLLAGCGQSGSLFLPAPAEAIETTTSPTAETTTAPAAESSAEN